MYFQSTEISVKADKSVAFSAAVMRRSSSEWVASGSDYMLWTTGEKMRGDGVL